MTRQSRSVVLLAALPQSVIPSEEGISETSGIRRFVTSARAAGKRFALSI